MIRGQGTNARADCFIPAAPGHARAFGPNLGPLAAQFRVYTRTSVRLLHACSSRAGALLVVALLAGQKTAELGEEFLRFVPRSDAVMHHDGYRSYSKSSPTACL